MIGVVVVVGEVEVVEIFIDVGFFGDDVDCVVGFVVVEDCVVGVFDYFDLFDV